MINHNLMINIEKKVDIW